LYHSTLAAWLFGSWGGPSNQADARDAGVDLDGLVWGGEGAAAGGHALEADKVGDVKDEPGRVAGRR